MTLDFYLHPPELTHLALLEIEALAPLSMVATQPGTYYRSAAEPTPEMILGMLENAIGLYLDADQRKALLKDLTKAAKKAMGRKSDWADHPWLTGKSAASGSGYVSLLQHHVQIVSIQAPETDAYDDLCSFHFRTDASTLAGGTRSYDYRLESLVSQSKQKDGTVDFGDGASHERPEPEELLKLAETWRGGEEKLKIHTKALHYYYPRYYVSPKVRGYVIPQAPYFVQLRTTATLAQSLKAAIDHPQAPLYLGTNDSWVDVTWKDHEGTE